MIIDIKSGVQCAGQIPLAYNIFIHFFDIRKPFSSLGHLQNAGMSEMEIT